MDNQVSKDINPTWRYPPVESPDQRMIRWWTWRGRKKVPQCRCWLCTGRSRRCLRARSLRALSPCCSHWTGGLQVNIVSPLYIFPPRSPHLWGRGDERSAGVGVGDARCDPQSWPRSPPHWRAPSPLGKYSDVSQTFLSLGRLSCIKWDMNNE